MQFGGQISSKYKERDISGYRQTGTDRELDRHADKRPGRHRDNYFSSLTNYLNTYFFFFRPTSLTVPSAAGLAGTGFLLLFLAFFVLGVGAAATTGTAAAIFEGLVFAMVRRNVEQEAGTKKKYVEERKAGERFTRRRMTGENCGGKKSV